MRLALLLACAASLHAAAEPIQDEALHLEVLQKLFPGLTVRKVPGRTANTGHTEGIRHPIAFPDAFATLPLYQVIGSATTEIEVCASRHDTARKAELPREVRLQLYRWPVGAPSELLAVLQYRFPNADPGPRCTSIAYLAHLTGEGEGRELLELKALNPWCHYALQSVRLVDLTGDGIPELLVESDTGDAATNVTELLIYELAEGDFHRLFSGQTRWNSEPADSTVWTQTLDVARTQREKAKRFCFEKTVYADSGKWFTHPKLTRPCYPQEVLEPQP